MMSSLPIRWQRLVKDGATCARCGDTEVEVRRATETLRQALAPLGIEPQLEVVSVDETAFAASPLESNRIWIADRPMEDWLSGSVGSSRCCSVCGDADCRTLEIQGTTFETIPERLIVKAGLLASAEQLDGGSTNPTAPTEAETTEPRPRPPTTGWQGPRLRSR